VVVAAGGKTEFVIKTLSFVAAEARANVEDVVNCTSVEVVVAVIMIILIITGFKNHLFFN